MTSGGARPRSGPPPDPNALRRDRKSDGEWLTLDAAGRKGEPPAWPLPDITDREAEVWASYWTKPQAILWQHNRQEHEVALHVRRLVEAEAHDAPTGLGTLVRQQMDALLLTIPAMHAARVLIAPSADEVKAKREAHAVSTGRASARDRLKAIDAGGA